jgi:hypothetical protein
MTSWYKQLPPDVHAHPRVDDMARVYALRNGLCLTNTTLRGSISDSSYGELEKVIIGKLGFKPALRYYRIPNLAEKDMNSPFDFNSFDEFTELDRGDEKPDDPSKIFRFSAVFLSDEGYLTYRHGGEAINSNLDINVFGEEIPEDMINSLSSFFRPGKKSGASVKMFTVVNGDYDITDVGTVGLPIERENYATSVMEGYDRVVNTLLSGNNEHGSIVILEGAPGTGKSYLIRGLMEDMRANFIFIPVNTVENLVNPSVIPILLSQYREGGNKPLVLIIEDGDATILSRKTHTNSLISTVLNMGDGILGQLLHTRMIISTNVPKTEIDPAVLRAGRLNAYIEVPPVDREQANSIYKRLSGKEFDFKEKTITLADVYGKVNESQNNFKVAKKKQEDTGQYA